MAPCIKPLDHNEGDIVRADVAYAGHYSLSPLPKSDSWNQFHARESYLGLLYMRPESQSMNPFFRWSLRKSWVCVVDF